MARPAVDLPDPLNENAPGALHSADDLLAQLAGEEIDRLLSEADDALPTPNTPQPQTTPRPATRSSATPTPAPSSTLDDAVLDATESALDDLLADPTPAPFSGAAEGPQAAPQKTAPAKPPTPATDPIAAAILADPTPAPAAPTAAPLSAADALAAELEADEAAHSAALQRMKSPAPAPVAADDPDAPAVIDVDESEIVSERIPLIVRILEVVNAPLNFLPIAAREALGKIALVTTLNALAILAYVLIFRRPH